MQHLSYSELIARKGGYIAELDRLHNRMLEKGADTQLMLRQYSETLAKLDPVNKEIEARGIDETRRDPALDYPEYIVEDWGC